LSCGVIRSFYFSACVCVGKPCHVLRKTGLLFMHIGNCRFLRAKCEAYSLIGNYEKMDIADPNLQGEQCRLQSFAHYSCLSNGQGAFFCETMGFQSFLGCFDGIFMAIFDTFGCSSLVTP
jgi:hypothetical protein